jgi:hypothetical protein
VPGTRGDRIAERARSQEAVEEEAVQKLGFHEKLESLEPRSGERSFVSLQKVSIARRD